MFSERLRQLEQTNNTVSVSESSRISNLTVEDVSIDSRSERDAPQSLAASYEFAGLGIGFASMVAEVVLSHPFVVIRSQCQVRSCSTRLHLFPFSLLPVVSKCVQIQGLSFLWKGLGSVFIVRGLCLLSENFLSEITSLPKEVSCLSSVRRLSGHVFLKVLSWILVTPFYAASVVELVQSDKASEPTTLISCLRSGFCRLFHMPSSPRLGSGGSVFRGGAHKRSLPISTSRLLSTWRLIPSVVLLNVGHYVIRSIACVFANAYWGENEDRLEIDAELDMTLKGDMEAHERDFSPADKLTLVHQRQETALQTIYTRYYTDLLTAMTANLAADVITYPLETLVVRLCVQGTRTLVDNMDSGDVVVPVVSSYEGFADALRSALDSPLGLIGLYRGFGALIAQYAIQAAFLYGIRCLYQQILYMWPPPPMLLPSSSQTQKSATSAEIPAVSKMVHRPPEVQLWNDQPLVY
ncbi:Mitochondrial substrate solute carrier [Fasciola gigantica]|uniref:Mitochondrial substrate solute carrier n=1 Tax=Fasciola gigantica TaxID=46835 RepID=A0A504YSB5_FASGI|nr:Mitochondrial substrate solute carrier [Fasciola gigantica]